MENNSQLAVREKESNYLFAASETFEASNEYKMNLNREAGFAFNTL